jgi:hypothetical protein
VQQHRNHGDGKLASGFWKESLGRTINDLTRRLGFLFAQCGADCRKVIAVTRRMFFAAEANLGNDWIFIHL